MVVRKEKRIVHTEALGQGNIHKEQRPCGRSRSTIEYCQVFRTVSSAVCVTEMQGANDYNLGTVGNFWELLGSVGNPSCSALCKYFVVKYEF
jgi:hypothetical protein